MRARSPDDMYGHGCQYNSMVKSRNKSTKSEPHEKHTLIKSFSKKTYTPQNFALKLVTCIICSVSIFLQSNTKPDRQKIKQHHTINEITNEWLQRKKPYSTKRGPPQGSPGFRLQRRRAASHTAILLSVSHCVWSCRGLYTFVQFEVIFFWGLTPLHFSLLRKHWGENLELSHVTNRVLVKGARGVN